MLRECHRTLRQGGRLAGYVIHTPEGLGASDMVKAAELGPSEIGAPGSPQQMAESVGFSIVQLVDVTAELEATAGKLLRVRTELEEALRAEEGDERYDEEQEKAQGMVDGVGAGLVLRSLVVAERV